MNVDSARNVNPAVQYTFSQGSQPSHNTINKLWPNKYLGGGQKIVSIDDKSGNTYCVLDQNGLFKLTSPFGTMYFNTTPASYVVFTDDSQLVLTALDKSIICFQKSPDVGALIVRGTGSDMRIVFTDQNGSEVGTITNQLGYCIPPSKQTIEGIKASNVIIQTYPVYLLPPSPT